MKVCANIALATSVACLFATTTIAPATARHLKKHHHVRMVAHMPATNAGLGEPDPYGVYFGGTKVSRDPDPHVRQQLLMDYWAIYRW